jgi:hypothetical protein
MQLDSVYLYPNRLDAYTNIQDWEQERYRQVYQRNLKLYRGSSNKIEFRVKSSDQKFKNIGDAVFVFSIVGTETQELILQKDCVTQDSETGKIYVIISENEILNIEPGLYSFNLVYETRTNIDSTTHDVVSRYPAYVDSQYGSIGRLEIIQSLTGEPRASFEVSEFKYYALLDPQDDFYLSGIIYTNSQLVTPQSLHTFDLYMSNYSGRVIVQGSIDQGGNPQTWVDVRTIDYVEADREYVNIVGKYNFFRIKHIPDQNDLLGAFEVNQTIFGYYNVSINNPGRGYQVGTQLLIKGRTLGGETPTNDLTVTITAVGDNGEITGITWSGLSYNGVQSFIRGGTSEANTGTFDKILYR